MASKKERDLADDILSAALEVYRYTHKPVNRQHMLIVVGRVSSACRAYEERLYESMTGTKPGSKYHGS